jgi:hypothetical protein
MELKPAPQSTPCPSVLELPLLAFSAALCGLKLLETMLYTPSTSAPLTTGVAAGALPPVSVAVEPVRQLHMTASAAVAAGTAAAGSAPESVPVTGGPLGTRD